jgi:hypothetical protein
VRSLSHRPAQLSATPFPTVMSTRIDPFDPEYTRLRQIAGCAVLLVSETSRTLKSEPPFESISPMPQPSA